MDLTPPADFKVNSVSIVNLISIGIWIQIFCFNFGSNKDFNSNILNVTFLLILETILFLVAFLIRILIWFMILIIILNLIVTEFIFCNSNSNWNFCWKTFVSQSGSDSKTDSDSNFDCESNLDS